jgi:hypothetical protein
VFFFIFFSRKGQLKRTRRDEFADMNLNIIDAPLKLGNSWVKAKIGPPSLAKTAQFLATGVGS